MYEFLLFLHSWLRWAVVGLGIYSLFANYSGWQSQRKFKPSDKRLNTIFMSTLHLQLVIGLILYFGVSPMMQEIMADFKGSMKIKETRFWGMEHMMGMIVGIIIAQVGSIKSKKQNNDTSKFRTAFIYFLIALLVMMLMIPFGIWNVNRPLFRGF